MSIAISNNLLGSEGSELKQRAQNNVTGQSQNNTPDKLSLNYEQTFKRGPAQEPPKLDKSYNLEDSLQKAYSKAVDFANRILLDDELSMELSDQDVGDSTAIVTNNYTNKVVQEYDPVQVLQMYSSNYNLQGLVVDVII